VKIRLLWLGKTKEKYLIEGINYYINLIRPYAKLSIVEIKEEKGRDIKKSLQLEGKKILKQTKSYILLDEKGKALNSAEFSKLLKDREVIDFVIGGAYGVSDEIKKKASLTISLSKMTFTHEIARLLLLEQIYRSITIIRGKEYHR
jgi:23S rRNA (pseudouridine1915-N3)-methyltransferase